jgi:hypothetical protein
MDATLSIPFTSPRERFSLVRFPFPLGKRLLSAIRFPFPRGKGLGVRLLASMIKPKTISDGTKLPMAAEPSQNHYIWYFQAP